MNRFEETNKIYQNGSNDLRMSMENKQIKKKHRFKINDRNKLRPSKVLMLR